jgi:uncharacterized protein
VPSASALAATALIRLGKLTGDHKYSDAAVGTMSAAAGLMQQAPTAMGQMLLAVDVHIGPTYEMVLVGQTSSSDTKQALRDLRRRYLPNKVLAAALGSNKPPTILEELLSGRTAGNEPTLYVCEGFSCQEPAVGREAIVRKLDQITR